MQQQYRAPKPSCFPLWDPLPPEWLVETALPAVAERQGGGPPIHKTASPLPPIGDPGGTPSLPRGANSKSSVALGPGHEVAPSKLA